MTTFQAVVYGAIHGFSEFLPVSSGAHRMFAAFLFGWPEPSDLPTAALSFGALSSLLVYFRHDWASMISCFMQVIIYRKRPMTLDERLPIFIMVASAPIALGSYYLPQYISSLEWNPLTTAISIAVFGVPFWFTDKLNRKNKSMFDWNWFDSLMVGITQLGLLIPGCGQQAAALPGALIRNYKREASVKFVFFVAAPVLAASALRHFRAGAPYGIHSAMLAENLSWLTLGGCFTVTLLSGLLAIGGLMKHVQRHSFFQYMIYRWVLAVAVTVVYMVRQRGA